MRVLVKIGVNSDKNYGCDIPDEGTVKDLRDAVATVENVATSRINFIINGSRIDGDEIPLKHLNLDRGVIVILSSAPKEEEKKEEFDDDAYEVTFKKKPLGIRIQSNKKQINAYIVSYENDAAKESGAKLGSKILAVNGTKVDGWKTVDIEQKILELNCPLEITFLSREGMSGEELSQVEGLDGDRLPEKWVPDEKDEKAESDYKVTFNKRPFGTVVFSGKGGRSAYIVSFEADSVAPGLGVKAGSKIVAVDDLDVETWTAQHIQNEIMGKKLPLTLTLRGPEGLTADEYPVSQEETDPKKKEKKDKKAKKKKEEARGSKN